eukprot:g38770.t1
MYANYYCMLEKHSRPGSIRGVEKLTLRVGPCLKGPDLKHQLSCSSDAAWRAVLLQLHTVFTVAHEPQVVRGIVAFPQTSGNHWSKSVQSRKVTLGKVLSTLRLAIRRQNGSL